MMWKVYTKTGDTGLTSTANSKRIPKDSTLITLQGSLDEINSYIGHLRSMIQNNEKLQTINVDLKKIQHTLFLIGSEVSFELEKLYINETHISFLEKKIDFMLEKSPDINSFVYCSGNLESTFSQIIRTIIRKVEIKFLKFLREFNIDTFPSSYSYINRLSDYFFSLGRYLNALDGFIEEPLIF